MNRVLVTGGAGFIGSHLVEALHPHCEFLAVLDDLSTGRESNIPGVRLWVGDVTDPDAVAQACLEAKPDTIFHLAAQTSVAASMRDMVHDAEVNVLGTVNVLRSANQHGSRVIYASTGGAMYGECSQGPAHESNTVRSIAPYAVSKYCGESYLAAANRYTEFRNKGRGNRPRLPGHVMLRLANVYGPRQDPLGEAGVVSIFLGRLLDGLPPQIHGSGAQERDFIYVSDVVSAFLALTNFADGILSGVYNVGTGEGTRIDHLARRCAAALRVTSEYEYVEPRPGDLFRSVLSPLKLIGDTGGPVGWRAKTTLDQGLRLTAASMLPVEAA